MSEAPSYWPQSFIAALEADGRDNARRRAAAHARGEHFREYVYAPDVLLALATAALLAAVAPVAAYVARTPPGNAHADRCAALVDAVADYAEAVAAAAPPPGPNWQHITERILAYLEPEQPLTRLMVRTRAHLDALTARAALPLAQRMSAARACSHHLGTPDTL